MYKIVDFHSGAEVTPSNHIYASGLEPWEVMMDLDRIAAAINNDIFRRTQPSLSKYFPFLPIKNYRDFISLNEGNTPLLKSRKIGPALGVDLYFKQETQNPTGSFKDRGSALEISLAKEFGVAAISVASTGNMAASCSCYAALAGIPCFVFVPEGTPNSKLSQSIAFGGRIVQVRGTYNDAARIAENVARELNFYLAGDYAFRVEGNKTAAFEVIDQLLYEVPSYVIVPMGCGTNLTSYAKGFSELHQLGLIDDVPRMVGAQAEGAQSIVNAFNVNATRVETLKSVNTLCSAIAITRPLDGDKALRSIYQSNGLAVSVSDREILEAQYELSKDEGVYVEASCATSVAVLKKIIRERGLPDGKVVCVLTGDGLKDPGAILKIALKPPTIHDEYEFKALFESEMFIGKTVCFADKDQVLFAAIPTPTEVERVLSQHFGVRDSSKVAPRVVIEVKNFLAKGKKVSLNDLQDIIQTLSQERAGTERVLQVLDFEVITGKDRAPRASVKILLDGVPEEAESGGVGPVDAVINALSLSCALRLTFSLQDFNVVIRSQGTDATVVSELKLLDKNGRSAIGRGTSPDVIQAAIEAFVEAYNELV
jgi:threonine synthase